MIASINNCWMYFGVLAGRRIPFLGDEVDILLIICVCVVLMKNIPSFDSSLLVYLLVVKELACKIDWVRVRVCLENIVSFQLS